MRFLKSLRVRLTALSRIVFQPSSRWMLISTDSDFSFGKGPRNKDFTLCVSLYNIDMLTQKLLLKQMLFLIEEKRPELRALQITQMPDGSIEYTLNGEKLAKRPEDQTVTEDVGSK